jgi:hypothetical protein
LLTAFELARTWFPGVRKELIIKLIQLHKTRAGTNQIRLSVVMPLGDGKLVGMSSWLGASYDVIGKEDSLLTFEKWGHEITEMVWTIYTADDSPRPSQTSTCPLMRSFTLRRGKQDGDDEDLADINLQFEAYLTDSTELWAWCRKHYREPIFVKFETTQKELFEEKPVDDKQMTLGETAKEDPDEFEEARREATSKAHDPEFVTQ